MTGQPIPTERGPVHFYAGVNTPWDSPNGPRSRFSACGSNVYSATCTRGPAGRRTIATISWPFSPQLTVKKVAVPGYAFDILVMDRSREFWHPTTQKAVPPRFLDGVFPKLDEKDRFEALADWLTSPKNPYFARTMVNRIWAFLHGKGIADPPDAIHELPLTANDALLDALAKVSWPSGLTLSR